MVTIAQALEYLYPAGQSLRDWVVSDNGTGPKITHWSGALGPQPAQGDINAAMLPAAKAQRITAINAECRARLLARFGDPAEQISRSIGIYGAAEKAALETGIAATIDASNTASNAVLAAADIAAVEAVTVAWPVI